MSECTDSAYEICLELTQHEAKITRMVLSVGTTQLLKEAVAGDAQSRAWWHKIRWVSLRLDNLIAALHGAEKQDAPHVNIKIPKDLCDRTLAMPVSVAEEGLLPCEGGESFAEKL